MADLSEQAAMAQLAERLVCKYADLPPDHVSAVVQDAHARFERSSIRDFVPLLVERRANEELADAGKLFAAP